MNVLKDSFGTAMRRPLTYIALVAVPIIVCVFGFLYATTYSDPYERMRSLPVAVVNLDEGAVVDGERVNYGADMVDKILENDSVLWTEEGPGVASAEGVSDSGYYMAVVIPEDFSERIAAGKASEPEQAGILFYRNVRKNFMMATLAETVEADLRQTVNAQVSCEYASALAQGLADAGEGLQDAADGAGELADGLSDASEGAGELAGGVSNLMLGAEELADGAGDLSDGAGELDDGAAKAEDGARSLEEGASELAGGASDAADGASAVASGASALAAATSGDSDLASGADGLVVGLEALNAGAAALSDGADELNSGLEALVAGLDSGAADLEAGASELEAGLGGLADGLDGASSSMEGLLASWDSLTDDQRKAVLKQVAGGTASAAASARQLSEGAGQLNVGLGGLRAQLGEGGAAQDLVAGATRLSSAADGVADGASSALSGSRALSRGIVSIGEAAASLDAGTARLSAGASSLADGASGVSDGASVLRSGVSALGSGAGQLLEGAESLEGGMGSLVSGTSALLDGSRELESGIGDASDGASELVDSLGEGAADVNGALTTDADGYGDYIADPVEVTDEPIGDLECFGFGFAPLFLTICLWLASLLLFFVFDPFPSYAAIGAGRVRAVLGRWPLYLVMVGCTVGALLATAWAVGLQVVDFSWLVLTFAVVAVSFMALLQAFSLFDIPGKALAIFVLIVQIVCASGTFPAVLGSDFSAAVTGFLPFTYAIDAYREVLSGGNFAVLARDLAMVAAFGAGGLAASLALYPLAKKMKLKNDRAQHERLAGVAALQ